MGVYIKGFPLPNNCGACPLRLAWCRERIYMVNRPERCPLVPVPPHGDLIDRKELLADLEQSVVFSGRPSIGEIQLASSELRGANKIIERIKVAPVVVESEE